MAIINLDLVGSLSVTQGYAWRILLMYPGNVLGGAVRSAIKETYDGSVLTAFRPEPFRYDGAINRTRIPLTLSRQQSRLLPQTGSELLLYEVQFSPPVGDVLPLMAGWLQVKGTLL